MRSLQSGAARRVSGQKRSPFGMTGSTSSVFPAEGSSPSNSMRAASRRGGAGNLDAFWPSVIAIEHKSAGKDLADAIDQALDYLGSVQEREMPKLVIASDFATFRILDLDENTTFEFNLADLPDRLEVFAFVAGYQQRTWEEEPKANIDAAELMDDFR